MTVVYLVALLDFLNGVISPCPECGSGWLEIRQAGHDGIAVEWKCGHKRAVFVRGAELTVFPSRICEDVAECERAEERK